VLALARPEMRWTIVDSVGKKASAVRGFVEALGLRTVTVEAARAEELGRRAESREAFDLVTARALAPLPVLAEYGLPLARVGGHVLAWKGRVPAAELDAGGRAATRLGGGIASVAPSGYAALGEHCFVTLTKERPTPDPYPRRPGEPSRRPLG
jgi:16S rRNA (guanine527-N7)-methyltransferase